MPIPLFNFNSRALVNYVLVLLLFFSEVCTFLSDASLLCIKLIAVFLLILTLITNYKFALIKVFSIRTSRHIGLISGLSLLIIPVFFIYQLDILEVAFFLSLGVIFIILDTLTDYRTYRKKYTLL